MALHQYIGARYVPKFYENSLGTAEWMAGVIYEPLTIVTYNSNSYTSKTTVPANIGDPSGNPDYWVATGVYNQQIADLSDNVAALATRMTAAEGDIDHLEKKTRWYIPEDYGAAGDGVTDDTAAIQAMFDDMPTGSAALFMAPVYLISDTITITSPAIRVSGFTRSEFYPTIRTTKASGNSFQINASGVSFNDILFEGPLMASDGLVLVDLNADNAEMDGNIDAEFRNCGFFKAYIGVVPHGRNVRCFNCIFSSLIIGYRPEQTVRNTDNRGYVLTGNRFHFINTCIGNNVSNARTNKNFVISSNFADSTDTFFVGYGGGLVIEGNTISTEGGGGQASCIVINADALNSANVLNVIKDNVLNGKAYSAQGYGILLNGGKTIVVGNVLQYIGGSGVAGGAAAYAIVKNNFLNAVAANSTYSMQFASGATGVIENNTVTNSGNKTIVGATMTISDNEIIP